MARRRNRNTARNMAIAGGLMGGLSAVQQQQQRNIDERRQDSLLALRREWQQGDIASRQGFAEEMRQDQRTWQEGQADKSEAFQIKLLGKRDDLGRVINYDDPDLQAKFSNVEEVRVAAEAGERIPLEPRTEAGAGTAAWENTDRYQAASPAVRKIYDRVNKITESGAITDAKKTGYVVDLYSSFQKADRMEKTATLKSLGIDTKLTGDNLRDAVISAYQSAIDSIAGSTTSTGQPGSSQSNPVSSTDFTSRPPSGTWVRLSDGQVVQIP